MSVQIRTISRKSGHVCVTIRTSRGAGSNPEQPGGLCQSPDNFGGHIRRGVLGRNFSLITGLFRMSARNPDNFRHGPDNIEQRIFFVSRFWLHIPKT